MVLTVPIGSTVVLDLIGHSAINGSPITTNVALTSNAPEVATVPATAAANGTNTITDIPVTIAGPGSTDIVGTYAPADGSGPFVGSATLIVTPTVPGFVSLELVLRQV